MSNPAFTINPVATFDGMHTFDITGTAEGIPYKSQISLFATLTNLGQPTDIAGTVLQPDGTFDIGDELGGSQSFLYLEFFDPIAKQIYYAYPPLELDGDRRTEYVYSETDGTYLYSANFPRDGSTVIDVANSGESLPTFSFDTFKNHFEASNTFVFDPGHGGDEVDQFRIGGDQHDTLSFKGSDFGNDVANVIAHTFNRKGGAVIVDPVTFDTVKISGLFKKQIEANSADIAFHP